ncbi:MAG: CBS domain-containing protein [Anaerolineae bacterium]
MLVRDRMTSNPITLRPGSDPLAGLAICKSGGFCHLPVVDETGRLVGIITRSDIFAQFAEALGADTTAIRVTVRVPNRPGELAKLAGRIAQAGGNICSVVSHSPGTTGQMDLTLRVEGVDRDALLSAIQADPEVELRHVWEREVEGR